MGDENSHGEEPTDVSPPATEDTAAVLPDSPVKEPEQPIARPESDEGAQFLSLMREGAPVQAVTEFLAAHSDLTVDYCDETGLSALHTASLNGNSDLVKALIEQFHATIDIADVNGLTPLHYAAYRGHSRVASYLITMGANCIRANVADQTPLKYAEAGNHVATAEMIQQYITNLSDVLLISVESGNIKEATLSIKRGADVDGKYQNGQRPLHRAVVYGLPDMVTALICAGATVDAKDGSGRTPLHLACSGCKKGAASAYDCKALIEALVTGGADVNAPNHQGRNPLHGLTGAGAVDIAAYLMEHGADPNQRGTDGRTLLHAAVRQCRVNMVELIIGRSDVNLQDSSGRTAAHLAAEKGYTTLLKIIAQHGANMDIADVQGTRPIHISAVKDTGVGLESIINAGADVNAPDPPDRGRTALHKAVYTANVGVVRKLVQAGADPKLADEDGRTAMHMAAMNYNEKIVQLLYNAGADINALDDAGASPLAGFVTSGNTTGLKHLICFNPIPNVNQHTIVQARAGGHVSTINAYLEYETAYKERRLGGGGLVDTTPRGYGHPQPQPQPQVAPAPPTDESAQVGEKSFSEEQVTRWLLEKNQHIKHLQEQLGEGQRGRGRPGDGAWGGPGRLMIDVLQQSFNTINEQMDLLKKQNSSVQTLLRLLEGRQGGSGASIEGKRPAPNPDE